MVHAHSSSNDQPTTLSATNKHTARLFGSAVAGVTELFVFHPVDTVAKRLMSNKGQKVPNLNAVIFAGAASKGIKDKYLSLFPGLGFAAWYKISQRIYKFGGQPIVNDLLQNSALGTVMRNNLGDSNAKIAAHALSGMMIGVGEVILLPFDVLKIKSQTNPGSLKGRGFFSIVQQEGIRKLYAGAGWTAIRNAPGSLSLFGANAWSKSTLFGLHDGKKANLWQNFVSSSIGGVCSVIVASPFDVIKTRVQRADFASGQSGIKILQTLLREEGAGALFKGLVPKLLVVSPKLVFSFTIAQQMISYFEEHLASKQ